MKELNFDWSLLISIGSLLVSVATIVYTKYSNKINTKPYLSIFKTDGIVSGKEHLPEKFIRIELKNGGLGPAIITNYRVLHNRKVIAENNNASLLKYASELFARKQNIRVTTLKDHAVSTGESSVIFEINFVEFEKPLLEEYNKMLDEFELEIDFKDMYGGTHKYP